MVKIIGGKEFIPIDSNNASNNSIFLDSSDNKLKKKDNSGNITVLGGGIWFLDSSLYDVYDDFESYPTGNFTSNTKWDVSLSSTGTRVCEIVNSTNAGGNGKELHMQADATTDNPSVTIISKTLIPRKSYYTKIKVNFTGLHNSGTPASANASIGLNGQTGTLSYITGHSSGYVQSSLLIVYKNNDNYDIYIGGKKFATDYHTTNPQIYFKINASDGDVGPRLDIYIDDVIMSK